MKKIVIMLSLTALLISCGNKNEEKTLKLQNSIYSAEETSPGYLLSKKDPIELNWYVNQSWYIHKWGESEVTKQMEEDTGIKINFSSGDDQKLNALVASGSLPDIVTLDSRHDLTKSPKIEKLALPLNILAEKYDPYFFKVANKELMKWNEAEDNNTYVYQNYAVSKSDYLENDLGSTEVFLVRKDMYEAIGSPDMSTKDGFLNALKLVKEKYPEENGSKIIPLGMDTMGNGEGALGKTLQNFLAIPIEENGNFYDRTIDEEYKRWIKVFNECLKSGYMTIDTFSDTNEKIDEKLSQGRYFAYLTGFVPGKQVPLNSRLTASPEASYIAINGPKNSNGKNYELQGPNIDGWTVTFINKKAKNPERIIQMFTYLISEKGQEAGLFGREGKTYEKINGLPKMKPEIVKMVQENPKKFVAEIGIGEMWQFGNSIYETKYREVPGATKQPIEWTKGKVVPKFEIIDIDPEASSLERKQLNKINDKWNETIAKLIISKNDEEFSKIFDGFIEFRNKNGWDKILQIRNNKIQKNIKKLTK
ncbi:MAG: extracellular solute-binding protein [Cetobacterium sp.]